MEILETKEQLECHCCCSSSDVFICELDNCEYPLCSTCKEKALKIEHKCPGCRRNIILDIEEENSILEEDIDYICQNVYYDKIIHFFVYNYNVYDNYNYSGWIYFFSPING